MITFFLYRLDDGEVFLMLESAPSNTDYLTNGEIYENRQRKASGIKWENVGIWENEDGVLIDNTHSYTYDAIENELMDNGVINA